MTNQRHGNYRDMFTNRLHVKNQTYVVRPVKRDWAVLSKDTPVDISILKSVNQRVFIHL